MSIHLYLVVEIKKEWTLCPIRLYVFMSCYRFNFVISRWVVIFIFLPLYPRVERPQRPSNRNLGEPDFQLEVL